MTSKYRKQIHAFLGQLDTLGGPAALREVMIEYVFNRIPPQQLQLVFDEISSEYKIKSVKLDQQEADPVRQMVVSSSSEPVAPAGKKLSVAEMLAAARQQAAPPAKPQTLSTAQILKNLSKSKKVERPKQVLTTAQILAACRGKSAEHLPLAGVPTDLDMLEGAVREDLLQGSEDHVLTLGDDFLLTPMVEDEDDIGQVISLDGDFGDDATATLLAGDVPGLGEMLDLDDHRRSGGLTTDFLRREPQQPQSGGFLKWFGLGLLFIISVVATSVAILHFVFKLPIQ